MKVLFFAYFRDREYIGKKELDVKGCDTTLSLLTYLSDAYGEKFRAKALTADNELGGDIIVLKNGRHIVHYEGINTPLEESDVVSIFPLVAGG